MKYEYLVGGLLKLGLTAETERGNEHHVKLPDWFIEKEGL